MAAGVVIGAGACYCVYRLTWGRDENEIIWNEDDDEEEESRDISETGKGAKANAGAGAGARLQGDAKAKAEVAVELKSGPDVKAEAHSKAESGGGLEAKAKALFSTLKEQASAKAGKAAKLGTIFGTRALAPGFPCLGVRGGGCHPVRSGARAGSKDSGKSKGRTRIKSTRTPALLWPVQKGKFNFPYKIDHILGATDL